MAMSLRLQESTMGHDDDDLPVSPSLLPAAIAVYFRLFFKPLLRIAGVCS